jgi:LysM repeat protein
MKYLIISIYFLFLASSSLLAQSKNIEHKVKSDETIKDIAKKYDVSPKEIYQLNPDVKKGIKVGTVLIIPLKSSDKKQITTQNGIKKHEVKAKETLYSISKLYDVSIENITSANPEIVSEGIHPGQMLLISNKKIDLKKETNKNNWVDENIIHEVKAKETKYSLAKQYNLTVDQLEKLNPDIASGLPLGYKLIVGTKKVTKKTEAPKITPVVTDNPKPKSEVEKTKVEVVNSTSAKSIPLQLYIIKPKETIYSLSRQFDLSQEELINLNPELKNGVAEGMTIKIPNKQNAIQEVEKEYVDLTKKFKAGGSPKKLALLLPFNITKIDKDTVNSISARLNKDKFLNLTLDFYAGALIAIDSVKKMGMNLEVKILDSNESKNNSKVSELIKDHNLKTMNAIIGPFYQGNAEKTAELLSEANVAVISPLSNDYNKSYPNLLQATPSAETVKNRMFQYMRSKNASLFAVIDPKKNSSRQYLADHQKDVILVPFNENETLNTDFIKANLSKDKPNYFVMETARATLILSLTNVLQSVMNDYTVKLVILQENETLDFEEIDISRLTKLNMHYPSITRPNLSSQSNIFEKEFKKQNNVLPNHHAIRGFDVTFDVLMRMSQEGKTFMETIDTEASQEIENKFNYNTNPNGGYNNTGVHILFYDTDLTIKEAK